MVILHLHYHVHNWVLIESYIDLENAVHRATWKVLRHVDVQQDELHAALQGHSPVKQVEYLWQLMNVTATIA